MNIYTDGACKENNRENGVATGKGGWAFLILEIVPGENQRIIGEGSGSKAGTTNQEMEITAVARAFENIGDYSGHINLYSDSAYVINCLKDRWFDKWRDNGWLNSKGNPVENKDAWEEMLTNIEKHDVSFFHVKRNTTKFIRMVDGIAKDASKT